MTNTSLFTRARPALEVLTVGLPFCAFKILSGLLVAPRASGVGYALLVLGSFDLAVNAINLLALTIGRPRVFGICATQMLAARTWRGGSHRHDELGTSVDVFLSFVLVAVVIGAGWLTELSRAALQVWNVAVIFNVLGAGFGRLWSSVELLRASR